jgi:recombination protein RecA
MADLSFLKNFKKNVAKIGSVNVGIMRTTDWLSTGNYALNYAISGDFRKGIPLNRISLWAGPSGSGKSFISSNIMAQAQKDGYHILVIDTENALDLDYLNKIGVNTSEDKLTYTQVVMIEDVNRVLSEFFSSYSQAYGKDKTDSPKVLIVIDSLAGLSSSTELENYERDGTIKGDQGQLAKRRKAMLRMITNHIARIPVAVVATDHVYPQDIMLGDGAWAITNSTKFSTSIIGIITKLKLKEGTDVIGVRMRFETYKSRFAKIGTKIELEVPYSKGMSPFSGLTELLEALGVIAKGTEAGEKMKWVSVIDGKKHSFKDADMTHELANELFKHPKATPLSERDEPEGFEVAAEADEE